MSSNKSDYKNPSLCAERLVREFYSRKELTKRDFSKDTDALEKLNTDIKHQLPSFVAMSLPSINSIACYDKRWHYGMIAAVVGTILANLPNGVLYFYGNLAAYTDSYFVVACESRCNDVSSASILSFYVVCQTIGMLCSRPLVAKLGFLPSLTSALLLADIGYLLSYFSVQSSVAATVVTLGGATGVGHGMVLALSLFYVTVMVTEYVGALYACVSSSGTIGSVIVNQMITYFINPDNEKADESRGQEKYFSDPGVLSRVPLVCLVIGTFSVGCHIAAIVFLKVSIRNTKTSTSQITIEKGQSSVNLNVSPSETLLHAGVGACTKPLNCEKMTNYATFEAKNGHVQDLEYQAVQLEKMALETSECNTESISKDQLSEKPEPASKPDHTPLAMLRDSRFYVIWVSLAALHYGFLQKSSYYKILGELWINDDQFLTIVGTLWPLVVLPSRLILGIVLDRRILTFKDAIVFGLATNSVLLVFWYFTPSTNQWLYMFWTFGLAASQSGIYVTYPVTVLRVYGLTYYTTNLGLMLTATMIASLVSPVLNESLLASGGWFWLLFTPSTVSFVTMVVMVIFVKH